MAIHTLLPPSTHTFCDHPVWQFLHPPRIRKCFPRARPAPAGVSACRCVAHGSPDRASGDPCFRRSCVRDHSRRSPAPSKKLAHRGFGCTWRAHPAQHRVPYVRRGGAHPRFPGDVGNGSRMEARRGPIRVFSGCPIVSGAPRAGHPASPDARSREPSPRTTAAGRRRPSRTPRLCKIAHQVFVEAGPGALPARIAAPADDRDEHVESPSKNADGPSLRPHHLPSPHVPAECPTRNGKALPRLREHRRTTAEPRQRIVTQARPVTKSTKSQKEWPHTATESAELAE